MGIEARIQPTKAILGRTLCIPEYQRPYRWTPENVLQLLEDVKESLETGKQEYRIGTVILYRCRDGKCKGSDLFEIVDGQQRLTTILIILWQADKYKNYLNGRNDLQYQDNSIIAIRENIQVVSTWMKDYTSDDVHTFVEYLLEKCKFAEIIVDDLSEAFQMFDTQNGRGKSLELYNLLKAYHIRAMEQNPQDEKIQCDRNWESATQYDATPDIQDDPNEDILGQLFREQLFKSRLWCRNEDAKSFTKDDIGEFKGCTIDKNHPIDSPFQNPFLLQYLTEKFYRNVLAGTIGAKSRFETGETEKMNPFVNINQPIVNGKAFFEYVETYVELYKKMFFELGSYQLSEFKKFFYLNCLTYNPRDQNDAWESAKRRANAFRDNDYRSRRTGDTYLREVYKSLCFVLIDRFGERVFLQYYETLYRLVFQIRLKNKAVRASTAMSEPKKFFSIIARAKCKLELRNLLDELKNCLKEEDRKKKERWQGSDKMPEDLVKFIRGA